MNNFLIGFRLGWQRFLTKEKRTFIIVLVFITITILLFLAYKKCGCTLHDLYYFFNLNYPEDGVLSPVYNGETRFFWIGVLGSLFFSAIITPFITNSIERRVDRIRNGQVVFNKIKNHYVMIGYNHQSINIINKLPIDCKNRLIILTKKNPIQVRAEIQASIKEEKKELYIIIYAGGQERISDLKLKEAIECYILVESNEWQSQYTHSMAMLEGVALQAKSRTKRLKTDILISDIEAYNLVNRLDLPKFEGINALDIHPFNLYDNWARLLWSYNGLKDKNKDNREEYTYDRLDFEAIENTDKHVHLVIVGFNSMGRALWQEAVRIAHFPNFDEVFGKNKTVITIIDPKAEEIKEKLIAQYPNFQTQITDIQFDFKSNRIEDEGIRNELDTWATDEKEMLTVAICFSDPDIALTTALSLPESLFAQYNRLTLTPKFDDNPEGKQIIIDNPTRARILVRQSVRKKVNKLFNLENKRYEKVKFFGNYSDAFNKAFLDDKTAILVNGIYCKYLDNLKNDAHWSISDDSLAKSFPDWENKWLTDTSEQHKLSTRYQIDHYRTLLAILERDSRITLTEKLAQTEHLRWIAERTLAGWRQTRNGEKRVDELKIHTDIMPYHELASSEKTKDRNVVKFAQAVSKTAENLTKTNP